MYFYRLVRWSFYVFLQIGEVKLYFLQIGEVKERRKPVVRPRDKVYAATKTAIVDKSQASEAKTDKYVRQGSSYCTNNRFEN